MRMDEEFFRKRRVSTIIFVCYNFMYGLDSTAITVSLLYYLKDFFSGSNPNTMYSVVTACSFIATIFGIKVGNICDKARNIRLIMSVMLFVIGIGNLIYSLPYSIWCVIIGRFLSGFATPLSSTISGELARLYKDPVELEKVLFIYGGAFSFGYVIGPATAACFATVNISIGSWHITKDNFIGVVLFFAMFLLMFATIFGVDNLSKQDITNFETQHHRQQQQQQQQQRHHQQPQRKQHSISTTSKISSRRPLSLKDILTDPDIMLVIFINTSLYFFMGANELLIVLVSRNTLGLSLQYLSTAIFVASIFHMTFLLLIWRVYLSGNNPLRGFMFCLWCGCYTPLLLVFLSYVEISQVAVKCILVGAASFTSVTSGIPGIIASREVLFRIVPDHSASFVDTVRTSFAIGLGLSLGALLAAFMFEALLYCSIGMCTLLILLTIPLYLRKDMIYRRMGE